MNYNANLDIFFSRELDEIRKELLSLNGIGKETADSILLYAGNKCIFVIDAYTKRLSKRLNFNSNNSYDSLQDFYMRELKKLYTNKKDLIEIFNELHALIVLFSKNICKKNPDCEKCFILSYCRFGKCLLK